MNDPVYKLIELTGTSTTSIEDAVDKAIRRAHKTIKNLCWFQLVETRGNINKGKVDHWQVTIKVGFSVEDLGRVCGAFEEAPERGKDWVFRGCQFQHDRNQMD